MEIPDAQNSSYRHCSPHSLPAEDVEIGAHSVVAAGPFREFVRRVVSAKAPYKRGICPLRRQASSAEDG